MRPYPWSPLRISLAAIMTVLICWIGFATLHYLFIVFMDANWFYVGDEETVVKISAVDWKNLDPYRNPLPTSAIRLASSVDERAGRKNVKGVRVYYKEASVPSTVPESDETVLLLHGSNFSSENWSKLGTLALMAALGHRTIAVDLPGFGETGGEAYRGDRGAFLAELVSILGLKNTILVAPSMSGSYAMPYIAKNPSQIIGFVPVAPTSTNDVPQTSLSTLQIPTMAVYGGADDSGLVEQSLVNLQVLPFFLEVELVGAGHPAYLVQPLNFHTALHNFMLALALDHRCTTEAP